MCTREKTKEYAQKNPDKIRANKKKYRHKEYNKHKTKVTPEQRLLWAYKLTPEQYKKLTKDGCEVCGSFEQLCVDHDHSCCPWRITCGQCIRGILCSFCNRAEGLLKSDPNRVRSLAAYLERYLTP